MELPRIKFFDPLDHHQKNLIVQFALLLLKTVEHRFRYGAGVAVEDRRCKAQETFFIRSGGHIVAALFSPLPGERPLLRVPVVAELETSKLSPGGFVPQDEIEELIDEPPPMTLVGTLSNRPVFRKPRHGAYSLTGFSCPASTGLRASWGDR